MTYGFKWHINIEEDRLIKGYDFTAGNAHDSQVFESLLGANKEEAYTGNTYIK